jgi:lipoprotein-anchoring transpeptidase ErfK/SrfK
MTRRQWVVTGAIALGGVAAALNAAAATAYFYDSAHSDMIASGVTIAGIDVGGLSASAARERLATDLVPRLEQPLQLFYGGRRFSINPQHARLAVDVDRMVDEAVAASRNGNLIERFVRQVRGTPVNAQIRIRAAYTQASVHRFVADVAQKVDERPRSARVIPSATKLKAVPARWGIEVRRAALAQELRARLVDPQASRTLPVPTQGVRPAITTRALWRKYATYITVSRGTFKLILWQHLKRAKTYTIAVGQAGLETPSGTYTINDKQVNPSWHVPNSAWAGELAGRVIPPGPDDPIKARWLGFYNGAGIHGTDAIYSLGSAASHGCIRMAIPDVEELYDLVPLGTPIFIG